MTSIRKTTLRRTVEPFNHQGRRIVVALEPGDVLAMREERTQRWFRAPIATVLRQIITWNVDTERAAKRANRKAART